MAKEITRTPFALYQPILAMAAPFTDTEHPARTTLILSEEAKTVEDGAWAWMDGEVVNYYPMVTDGKIDLRTLYLDVDWEKKTWRKDMKSGPIPKVLDVLFWIVSFSHPFIDFQGVEFTKPVNPISTLLNDINNYEPVPRAKSVTQTVATVKSHYADWGYGEIVETPKRLKKAVAKRILELEVIDSPLAHLDPHHEFIKPQGGIKLSDADLKLIEKQKWPAPKPQMEGVRSPYMIDLPDEAYDQFMTSHAKGGAFGMNLGERNNGYAYVSIPIPQTFKSTEEIVARLKRHLQFPEKDLEILHIRRLYVLTTGHFDSAEFSISYPDGEYAKGTTKKKVVASIEDWRKIKTGSPPLIMVEKGAKAPEGYVLHPEITKAVLYLGPCWRVDMKLEGKPLPIMYFADEAEFYEHAIKPIPQIAATWKGGKDLVYIMNGSWCERNFFAGQRQEGHDYHNPAVNNRSLSEWIYGPMAHNMSYSHSTQFKNIEVCHPVTGSNVDEVVDNYNKNLAAIRAANEKTLDPAILDFVNKQFGATAKDLGDKKI